MDHENATPYEDLNFDFDFNGHMAEKPSQEECKPKVFEQAWSAASVAQTADSLEELAAIHIVEAARLKRLFQAGVFLLEPVKDGRTRLGTFDPDVAKLLGFELQMSMDEYFEMMR